MRFEFATATRIIFGPGTLAEVPAEAARFGRHILLVSGSSVKRAQALLDGLSGQSLDVTTFPVHGEPTISLVAGGLEAARQAGSEVVIGLGGGSVLDASKAIAALLTNGGEPLDYIEVVGRGKTISRPSAPFIAIPTTAGTGTEVSRNAVLASPEHHVKASIRSPHMLARLAVIDPDLVRGAPPAVIAASGLDALTQLIEPYTGARPNPVTDALCLEGIRRAGRALRPLYRDSENAVAREDMALAALLSGIALANSSLGAVHGFAAPLGGSFDAPHGAVCARLLPIVMAANLKALQARQPDSPVIGRYQTVARLLTGDDSASAADGAPWVADLCAELAIPPLATYAISASDLPDLVAAARQASSMKGNPIALTDDELASILEAAL